MVSRIILLAWPVEPQFLFMMAGWVTRRSIDKEIRQPADNRTDNAGYRCAGVKSYAMTAAIPARIIDGGFALLFAPAPSRRACHNRTQKARRFRQ
jgi:hypothetical protein